MRWTKYKCPVYKDQYGCRFLWDPKNRHENTCECGMTYKDLETIWDKIRTCYYWAIPHKWRPNNLYWKIKAYFVRYTTIKSRYLGHEWHDRDGILIYTIFEIAERFIEQEVLPRHKTEKDWEWQKEHNPNFYESWKETIAIIEWFKINHDIEYPYNLDDEERKELEKQTGKTSLDLSMIHEQEIRNKAKRLIEISPCWWT